MIKIILAAAIGIVALPASAQIPNPPPMNNQPVIDAADIIPADREAALTKRLLDIKAKSGHEVAVVTVPDMGGREIEEYTINAARFYGIGTKDGDDGILFLIAPNQRKDRIEVGDGLVSIITDAEASRINDGIVVPMFKAGDFPGGIELGVEEIAAKIVPLTPEQLLAKKRAEAAAASRRAAFWASVGDFFLTVGATAAGIAGLFGLHRLATIPKRRRLERERLAKEEADRIRQEEERAAREVERQREREAQRERDRLAAIEEERRQEQARQREIERRRVAAERAAAEKRAREEMLAAMSPTKREAFLQKERDDEQRERDRQAELARQREIERKRQAAAAAAVAAERAAAEAVRREENRREEERRAAQRRRDDEEAAQRRRNEESSYSSSSSWSSSSSSSDFGGGGGSFSGGGDSGSW